jgi:large subunit ribosomal protein L17
VEPLITKSKTDTTHSRRTVFSYLQDKETVAELFRVIAQKVTDRPGGYTRIFKTGFRFGDKAEMCMIELVDYNETYGEKKEKTDKKAKTVRRGRGTSKKAKTEDAENISDESANLIQSDESVVKEPKAKKVKAPKSDSELPTPNSELKKDPKPKKKAKKEDSAPETPTEE